MTYFFGIFRLFFSLFYVHWLTGVNVKQTKKCTEKKKKIQNGTANMKMLALTKKKRNTNNKTLSNFAPQNGRWAVGCVL